MAALEEMDERRENIWSHLPIDLWTEIFVRLPVRTILTLKCVSKTFRSLIQTPNFAYLHFYRFNNVHNSGPDPKGSTCLIAINRSTEIGLVRGGLFQLTNNYNNSDEMTEIMNFGIKIHPDYTYGVMGNVNGLLWMCNVMVPVYRWESTETIIWNPFLRKTLITPSCPASHNNLGRKMDASMGFGYDPVSDDYKIVAVVFSNYQFVHQVYSLRSGCWRHIGCLKYNIICFIPQVNVDRYVYWVGAVIRSGLTEAPSIVCYDLHTDKFAHFRLPSIKKDRYIARVDFPLILNGSIAVFSISADHSWLWLLERSKGEWTWIQVFDSASEIELFNHLGEPISNAVFFPEEMKLMVSIYGKGVVSYCYKTHGVKLFNHHVNYLGTYKESLLWRELISNRLTD